MKTTKNINICLLSNASWKHQTYIYLVLFVIFPLCCFSQPQLTGFKYISTGKPNIPAPGDPFVLDKLVNNPPLNTAPEIAEWTKTAAAGQSVILSGYNLTTYRDTSSGKDAEFFISDGAKLDNAFIQTLSKDNAILTINEKFREKGMYVMWAVNQIGCSYPIKINGTEVWWKDRDTLVPGTTVQIFGRNLSYRNENLISFGYLTRGTQVFDLKSIDVNPYKVSFELPAALSEGEYQLWVHNGHGGDFGWSLPMKIIIRNPPTLAKKIINVLELGIRGDDMVDDTYAIQNAIKLADRNIHTTLFFPNGTYYISNTIFFENNLTFQGESREKSLIKCAHNFSSSGSGMFKGSVSNTTIQDITLDTDGNLKGEHSNAIFFRDSRNLKFTNCNFNFQGYDISNLDKSSQLIISNCNITGKILFLGSASSVTISNTHFFLTNDTEMAIDSWGGKCISVTGCSCQDFDISNTQDGKGWGKGRFFTARGNWGSSKFLYLANNKTINLGTRSDPDIDQNSGEQLLWEGFTSEWSGNPLQATISSLMLPQVVGRLGVQHIVVVTDGKGKGQARSITKISGNQLDLDEEWNVIPDLNSKLSIGSFANKIVVYKNELTGKPSVAKSDTLYIIGSSGIEPYGGVMNLIADNNKISNLRSGIANWATQHEVGVDPSYFNLFTNNTISECRWGIQNGLNNVNKASPAGSSIFGNTYRGNIISNTIQSGLIYTISDENPSTIDYSVYEFNSFNNVENGQSLGGDLGAAVWLPKESKGIKNTLFYKNHIAAKNSIGYGIKLAKDTYLRSNTYVGWGRNYVDNHREPNLQAPLRIVRVSSDSLHPVVNGKIELWNSGTISLPISCRSNANWVTIDTAKGDINSESDVYYVHFTVKSENLSIGLHATTIDIKTLNQQKAITILYYVASLKNVCADSISLDAVRNDKVIHLKAFTSALQPISPIVEVSNKAGGPFVGTNLSLRNEYLYESTTPNFDLDSTYYRVQYTSTTGCKYYSYPAGVPGYTESVILINAFQNSNAISVRVRQRKKAGVILKIFSATGQKLAEDININVSSENHIQMINVPASYRGIIFIQAIFANKNSKIISLVKV